MMVRPVSPDIPTVPLKSITVLKGIVYGITVVETLMDMGPLNKTERCHYGQCRARYLCNPKTCIGKNLHWCGYEIEFGDPAILHYVHLDLGSVTGSGPLVRTS